MSSAFSHTVMECLASSSELDKSLKRCFDYISLHLPIDGIYINTFQPELKQIKHWAHASQHGGVMREHSVNLTDEMCQMLQDPDRPLLRIISYCALDPVTECVLSECVPEAQSVILMRLNIGKQHLGVVGIYSKQEGTFNNRHAEQLQSTLSAFSLVVALQLQKHNLLNDNHRLEQENEKLKTDRNHKVIGADGGLSKVWAQVETISKLDSTVLILGETGVGKEVIANAIHHNSSRANKPFVKVNCGAIPESLIDSELFGYEKGAFTGAEQRKAGFFEQADGGTIFLDEIGELPPMVQVRLLRVLQQQTINRVGSVEAVRLDIRVIAATHRNLEQMIVANTFREDLWYRLSMFPIQIPPLRLRREDVPLLTHHFMLKLQSKLRFGVLPQIDGVNMERLLAYGWPGNVRELENAVERAMIQYDGGCLNFNFLTGSTSVNSEQSSVVIIDPENPQRELVPLDTMLAKYISYAVKQCNGTINGAKGAAELLQVHPNTLRSKMKKLGI